MWQRGFAPADCIGRYGSARFTQTVMLRCSVLDWCPREATCADRPLQPVVRCGSPCSSYVCWDFLEAFFMGQVHLYVSRELMPPARVG